MWGVKLWEKIFGTEFLSPLWLLDIFVVLQRMGMFFFIWAAVFFSWIYLRNPFVIELNHFPVFSSSYEQLNIDESCLKQPIILFPTSKICLLVLNPLWLLDISISYSRKWYILLFVMEQTLWVCKYLGCCIFVLDLCKEPIRSIISIIF